MEKDPPARSALSKFLFELADFITSGKRWWLLPMIVVLLILSLFGVIAGIAPSMPFIYALF